MLPHPYVVQPITIEHVHKTKNRINMAEGTNTTLFFCWRFNSAQRALKRAYEVVCVYRQKVRETPKEIQISWVGQLMLEYIVTSNDGNKCKPISRNTKQFFKQNLRTSKYKLARLTLQYWHREFTAILYSLVVPGRKIIW